MKTSDKNLFIILCISAIIHGLIIFLLNFNFSSKRKITLLTDNKIEINLDNVENDEFSELERLENDINIKPETQEKINFSLNPINEVKVDAPVKVKKISETLKIEKNLYSNIADIPSDVPYTLTVAKKKIIKRAKVSNNIGKGKVGKNSNKKIIVAYLSKIRIIIEKHKKYPLIARKRGIEGKVYLEFELLKNGKVKNIKILKSSGSKILDNAAKKAILDSTPFPQFPKQINLNFIKVKLSILFKLS